MLNLQCRKPATAALAALALLCAIPAQAQRMPKATGGFYDLGMMHEKLRPADAVEPLTSVVSQVPSKSLDGWALFKMGSTVDWQTSIDKRTGGIALAEGGGIAWIPGHGNKLTLADISSKLKGKSTIDLSVMEGIARDFMARTADLLAVDPAKLQINRGRSGQPADHVWFVDFDVLADGLPVENARVVFRVNNGNLVQFGTELMPALGMKVPAIRLTADSARTVVEQYIGGFNRDDKMIDPGSLHAITVDVPDYKSAEGFAFGKGRGLAKVWEFTFKRPSERGTWRARVDATTGEMLSFLDINEYAQATGGVYMISPSTTPEAARPMPFTNLSSGGFTNSAGAYTFGGGTVTSSLAGQYVRISDRCGSISLTANSTTGDFNFGSSSGTDCTTPGVGGAGNTHSARTMFYQVNRIKETGRGWLPGNTWLTQQLVVNTNLNLTCNAYWNGSSLNFYRSGGGCANSGEFAGIALHEYGHGLDQNDGNGSASEGGTGEAYGDFTAALATHSSCIGSGFLTSNCSGYGNACTSCSGARDIDWGKHTANTPSTVANYTQPRCPANPAGRIPGPCGKEVHCESTIPAQAAWDLPNRDLPNPGTGSAWTTAERLWYASRSTSTASFTCTASGTFTSNGCGTGSWWKSMRAVDDDDGNLTNGTPHSCNLFAAFNRHGIACTTDAGANTCFTGCSAPATPSFTLTPASGQVTVVSTGTGVFDVFRNEVGCNAGFARVSSGNTGTFVDTGVANGATYFYQVVAHTSGNDACASAPATCVSVVPGSTCTPPGVPTGVTASGGTNSASVSWTAVAGATEYHILRSTTSGGPYTQVGTSTLPSFSDSGLACGTTYFYVVRAANSATCEGSSSAQASATTAACSTCTPPAAPTTVTATGGALQATVNWTAVSGATEYHILRSTTSGGPYTQVGTSTTTSFTNTGLTCGTTYFYVVRAANSATCESGNSTQASATTSTCSTCTTRTLYSNNFDTTTGLSGFTTGTFLSGGATTDWRGVQACTPTGSGANVFRFGGTTCTGTYASNRFAFAQPNGAGGIAIPAGANTTRLTFKHRRNFESGFDGGTLTASIDGNNYEFVPASAILAGTSSYNGTLSASCPPAGAAGASVFTGSQSTMVTTTVDLDAVCNLLSGTTTGCAGRSVRIGFTSISDCSVTSTGWFIDDVSVSACAP